MAARRWICLLLIFAVGCNGGGINSGDRVLVAKCLYETGVKPPERFDVVVFKFPGDRHGEGGPMKDHVPTNYIKRLLGLPGEVIMIFFGQIFRMTPAAGEEIPGLPQSDDPLELWRWSNQPTGSPAFQAKVHDWIEGRKFEILRKPPAVMMAMRRIVNDNKHQPADLKNFPDAARWRIDANSGWTPSADRRTFSFKPGDGKEIDWLTYQHRIRPSGRALAGGDKFPPRLITDTMGYNDTNLGGDSATNWVGDLMLEAKVSVTQPGGEFYMELNRGANRFQAKWDLTSGQCTLSMIGAEGVKDLGSAATPLRGVGTHTVRFANFDARLTVWVDEQLPFGDGAAYDPPEFTAKSGDGKANFDDLKRHWGPTQNDLTRPAGFGGKGAAVDVTDVKLWRNTYYTMNAEANHPDVSGLTFDVLANPADWGRFKEINPTAYYVYPKHYMCMGDNSTHSSDSRAWGMVPDRLMLGRALMVYYPLDRAGLIR